MNENYNVLYAPCLENVNVEQFTTEKQADSRYEIRWLDLQEHVYQPYVGIEILDLTTGLPLKLQEDEITFITVWYGILGEPSDAIITCFTAESLGQIEIRNVVGDSLQSVVSGAVRFVLSQWPYAMSFYNLPASAEIMKKAYWGDLQAQADLIRILQQESNAYRGWVEISAMNGIPDAQYSLACIHQTTEPDEDLAKLWLEKAANQEWCPALNCLAEKYESQGEQKMAVFLWSVSASAGNEEAKGKLKELDAGLASTALRAFNALLGREKKIFFPDVRTVEDLAHKGDSFAQFQLAKAYEEGKWGVCKDMEAARKLYSMAMDTEINQGKEAWHQEYYAKALELGDLKANVWKFTFDIFEEKWDEMNPAEILQMLHDASDAGIWEATDILGTLYEEGSDFFNVEKDVEKMFHYMQLAMKQGSEEAISGLGYLYLTGKGVDKDQKKGLEMLLKGTEAKSPDNANHDLAYIYATGLAGEVDLEKAAACQAKVRENFLHGLKAFKKIAVKVWFKTMMEIVAIHKALRQMDDLTDKYDFSAEYEALADYAIELEEYGETEQDHIVAEALREILSSHESPR